jgi:hypothetical protein
VGDSLESAHKPDLMIKNITRGDTIMRKYFRFLLIAIFPYLIVLSLLCIFTGFIMDTVFRNNVIFLLLTLLIFYVITLLSSVTLFIISLVKKKKALEVLRINMIIKMIHIPAYLFIFIVGLICSITIFTFGITIVLIMLDLGAIVLSGLLGLAGVIRGLSENKISLKAAVIHGILQFVFCADIISSVVLFRKAKAAEYIVFSK